MATAFKRLANRATGNLEGGVDAITVTWVLEAGQGALFPSFPGNEYILTCENERVRVTGRTTDTLTVVRGQDGTSAAAHADAVAVELLVRAGDLQDIHTAVNAIETSNADGWVAVVDAWTFLSTTTVTVPSGAASRYQKGDKVKFTQTDVKFFYVIGVTDTVLTLTGGSDFTVANAAISAIFYSKMENPHGFPILNWVPGFTGFSTNPTVSLSKFEIHGSVVTVYYVQNALGTSNATVFTITGLPVAIGVTSIRGWTCVGVDSGANLADPVKVEISTTVMTLHNSPDGTGWTATSTKGVYGFAVDYVY